jgi:signal peptidase I
MKDFDELICNGPSMKPTLMPGDKIEVEEIGFDELRPGDIIVYDNPEDIRLNIIHRITGRDADGLITRGDNNRYTDPYRVRPEHRPLKVTAFVRGSERRRIPGHGMLRHHFRIIQRKAGAVKQKYLYPFFYFIADSGIFHPFGIFFKTEIREFKRPGGIERQLFSGGRRIGIRRIGDDKWHIRFPWRLFIKVSQFDKE